MSEQNHVGWHKVSKERRKAIAARYYQRHRKIIKLAMTLDIPMKEARAIWSRESSKIAVAPELPLPVGKNPTSATTII
jgi:hypothetical protein